MGGYFLFCITVCVQMVRNIYKILTEQEELEEIVSILFCYPSNDY